MAGPSARSNARGRVKLLQEGKAAIVLLLAGGKGDRYEGNENKLVTDIGLPSVKNTTNVVMR
jgi:hypothetical protein